jgi:hypothetical protein
MWLILDSYCYELPEFWLMQQLGTGLDLVTRTLGAGVEPTRASITSSHPKVESKHLQRLLYRAADRCLVQGQCLESYPNIGASVCSNVSRSY